MPEGEDLPAELADLTRQQAFVLNDQTWRRDTRALIELLRTRLPALNRPNDTGPKQAPTERRDPFDRILERIAGNITVQGDRQRPVPSRVTRFFGALIRHLKKLVIAALIVLFAYFVVTRYADPELQAVLREFVQFLQGLVQRS